MDRRTRVVLRDRELVGATGALRVLYQVTKETLVLDLGHNSLLGGAGLDGVLKGLVALHADDEEVPLERLILVDCGLGGEASSDSLSALASHFPRLPRLTELSLINNDLWELPKSFLREVFTHPSLTTLHLSTNTRLGRHWVLPSTASGRDTPVQLFLKHLLRRARSPSLSPLQLRAVYLNDVELDCNSSSLLLDVLRLGADGLEILTLNANELLGAPLLESLIDVVRQDNFFIQEFEVWACSNELFALPPRKRSEGDELMDALSRNRQLRASTREAAPEVLRAARIISLAIPPPSSSDPPPSPRPFPILSLPVELLQPILSSLAPGALSQRQVVNIIRYAADRSTLEKAGPPSELFMSPQVQERILKELSCWYWDKGI